MIYVISVYVPEEACERVKQALFSVGAGKLGAYDQCAWQVLGEGQFRPLPGSNPSVGMQEIVSSVREYKIEMVCAPEYIDSAVAALKAAHPYEVPAYYLQQVECGS